MPTFIRPLRCKVCRKRFKYRHSMILHLQDNHIQEIQNFLQKNDDKIQPEVVHVSVIKINTNWQ